MSTGDASLAWRPLYTRRLNQYLRAHGETHDLFATAQITQEECKAREKATNEALAKTKRGRAILQTMEELDERYRRMNATAGHHEATEQ